MKIISIALLASAIGLAPLVSWKPDGGAIAGNGNGGGAPASAFSDIAGGGKQAVRRQPAPMTSAASMGGRSDGISAAVNDGYATAAGGSPLASFSGGASAEGTGGRMSATRLRKEPAAGQGDSRRQIAKEKGGEEDRASLPIEVAGVSAVELSADDLARLGIRVTDMGIYSTWREEGKEKPFYWVIAFNGIIDPPKRMDDVEVPDCAPAAITDDVGGYRAFIFDETEEQKERIRELREGDDPNEAERMIDEEIMKPHEQAMRHAVQIGRLVPVLVRTGRTFTTADSLAQQHRPDAIFWYKPTREFLDRLPSDIRVRIEREMGLAEKLRGAESANGGGSGEIRSSITNDIKATVGERPYLDVLRGSAGALLRSELDPNPAREHATLHYRLSEPRTVSVALHDLSGRRLRELASSDARPAGESTSAVDLKGLSAGIYLVVISTDQGERGVQRLVVQP